MGKAVPVSHKTPVVLSIVKSDKSLVGDIGKKKIFVKGKNSLTFEKFYILAVTKS